MAEYRPRTAREREAAKRAREQSRRARSTTTTTAARRSAPRRRAGARQSYRGRRIAAVAVLVVAVAVVWFLVSLEQPFHGSGSGVVEVQIPADASAGKIGDMLSQDGVVDSSFFFKLRAELAGAKFRAGTFSLAHGMSYSAAIHVLTTAPGTGPVTNVTIVAGKSRWQLDQILKSEHVPGSYLADTRHSPLLDPANYGAPAGVSLEGFLYPDTYQLGSPLRIPALVSAQLNEFKQQISQVNMSYAKSKNLTPYDVLKIASLVDAEAALPSDLPKVASVIYNRLRLHMTLGLDTTIAYATHDYSGNLSQSELRLNSAYNTRTHFGLPPTPVNSPDLNAIKAAAHPAHTNYLYFIVKVCGNGALAFTSSYSQFLSWSSAYAQAEAKRGVNKAAFCHRG
jgi:UPF0755 protein